MSACVCALFSIIAQQTCSAVECCPGSKLCQVPRMKCQFDTRCASNVLGAESSDSMFHSCSFNTAGSKAKSSVNMQAQKCDRVSIIVKL